ncbi:hypothetical protein [Shinella granuli]|uniref:Uncharacterized protein n=1 Tax=Shinella granuli TaxID=323621 RepID=A0A4R2CHI8_SHIGR|nr:hypothetical protein [Shinella granuli]TCN38549.1 hypothetical protein EV665_11962 [Shinella granuli]
MLPRLAMTSDTVQPSLAAPASASVEAAAKPQPSAAALANLRAEVLLRLIEIMLKHMPRTGEASQGRDLLETLLAVLKALPGREGEGGRKLADILAKLPPELRPSVEKLIGTVLSSMPTRSLVEVLRNPSGPEAQKLAALLSTSLKADMPAALQTESQPKPLRLNAQQLAAVGRHSLQQAGQPAQLLGDARALQTMLKRIFDFDGSKPRPATARALETAAGRLALAVPTRLPVGENTTAQSGQPISTPTAKAGNPLPVEATEPSVRHNGGAEESESATPSVKREDMPARAQVSSAVGQALARSVLQAVTRDMAPAVLMPAVAQLLENLTPEEANFIRFLLERPLDPTGEADPALLMTDGDEQAEMAPETGKARATPAQAASTQPEQAAAPDEPLPMPQAREALQALQAALADVTPERLLSATLLREGIPLAFVPYLPAEEDLDWSEGRERGEEDEAANKGDGDDGEAGGEAGEDAAFETSGEEPEADDMAKRREKTAEMVGVIEPGLVFYQKLGDYWT